MFPPLFSCSKNEMRHVLADFATSEISKQVETRMILCWLLLFIQPLLIRLIAQCRRSPHHHHLPNAMPWRYLPKDNHATFETYKKNPTIIEKISQRRCSQALCNQPHYSKGCINMMAARSCWTELSSKNILEISLPVSRLKRGRERILKKTPLLEIVDRLLSETGSPL